MKFSKIKTSVGLLLLGFIVTVGFSNNCNAIEKNDAKEFAEAGEVTSTELAPCACNSKICPQGQSCHAFLHSNGKCEVSCEGSMSDLGSSCYDGRGNRIIGSGSSLSCSERTGGSRCAWDCRAD